jgi:LemA protein
MWMIIVLVSIVVIYVAWTFNRLIRLKQRTAGAWSDIDVQLKRRWDLVPAVVKTVQGYASHEKQTLEDVVAARAAATAAADSPAVGVAEQGLQELKLASAVANVLALVEDYPDLKADGNYLALHETLVDIENTLQHARRYYNAVVRDRNTLIESFPSNIVASLFHFHKAQFFQIDAAERVLPDVDLPG